MKGIKATVTMERTLYLDLPDNMSKEDILKKADEEIRLPINSLLDGAAIVRQANPGVLVPHLDLCDWSTTDFKYEIIDGQL